MARPDPEIMPSLLAHLRQHHPNMCRHWFDDIEAIDVAAGRLRLLVREPVQLRYLQRSCVDQFSEAARAVTGRLLAARFVGEHDLTEEGDIASETAGDTDQQRTEQDMGFMTAHDDMLLSPDYSFQTFVVGDNNRLAHAAARAVAEKPGRAYNPFFIHGGVGLGKTHLLQSICQTAMRSHPGMRIYYISCNAFMNQFMDAVQEGQMNQFRHRFRDVDMLLIDDIHDLSTRNRTQEEFFHTFNTLYQTGRQIVLSSDAPPNEIPDLEERLTSRFNCGLVAKVDRPCFETRVAIIQSKAALREFALPDDVASYIAGRIDSNIRELEGAINSIQNFCLTHQRPVSLEVAREAIGDQKHAGDSTWTPSIKSIIDSITDYYDVNVKDLLSRKRHKSVALPRQVGMWLARTHTRYSLEEIGAHFGGRDHTTVMHAVKTIDERRKKDGLIDQDVTRLEDSLLALAGQAGQSSRGARKEPVAVAV